MGNQNAKELHVGVKQRNRTKFNSFLQLYKEKDLDVEYPITSNEIHLLFKHRINKAVC